MHKIITVMALLGLITGGCGKDATTQACIKAADAYVAATDKRSPEAGQHLTQAINLCPLACAGGQRDPEACAADNRITEALCDLEGKAACDRMCDEDKNAAACTKTKTM